MESLLAGLALGFSAGVTPGPLLALVIASTLARGWRAGVQAAVAPLVSDLPIIVLCVTVVTVVPESVVGWLSIAGALVLLWFSFETLREARTADIQATAAEAKPNRAWAKAALVNALSPSPWLFWATIGGPILVASWRDAPGSAAAFMVGFYLLLIGTKVALAIGLGASRHRLSTRAYRATLAASGVLMVILAGILAASGYQTLTG